MVKIPAKLILCPGLEENRLLYHHRKCHNATFLQSALENCPLFISIKGKSCFE